MWWNLLSLHSLNVGYVNVNKVCHKYCFPPKVVHGCLQVSKSATWALTMWILYGVLSHNVLNNQIGTTYWIGVDDLYIRVDDMTHVFFHEAV